ncbi:MAG: hypothetical protein Q9219_001808 [cf. Caloplaca sp. 3 TL-2023]
MLFIQVIVIAFFGLLVSALPADSAVSSNSPAASTPRLVRIFQAVTNLNDFSPPIPIPGGQRIVASVRSGKITGPALNGTIQEGISVIDLLNNGQVIVNNIRAYGTSSDGVPLFIEESGVGSSADNFARLTLSVGGKYASLANQFLFTEATLSSDRKSVSTSAYSLLDK